MPAKPSDQELADAILQHAEYGAYPDSEAVVSAELPATALPAVLELVERTKEDVKAEVRASSREAAPDIDGWIAQAKQLQADIERSQATAREIIQQAEASTALWARADDNGANVGLLKKELAFNDTLGRTLEIVQSISTLLDTVKDAIVSNHLTKATEGLQDADKAISGLGQLENTRFAGLLQGRAHQLRKELAEGCHTCWNQVIDMRSRARGIVINNSILSDLDFDLDTLASVMNTLGILGNAIDRLHRRLDVAVVGPRLRSGQQGPSFEIVIQDNALSLQEATSASNAAADLNDVRNLVDFLVSHLPNSIAKPLSEQLMPVATSRLISHCLEPSVPTSLEGMDAFHDLLSEVDSLAEHILGTAWIGGQDLKDWVEQAPRTWLLFRKEAALATVRKSCFQNTAQRKTVERIETQMVSKDDVIAPTKEEEDDWGAEWADEEQKDEEAPASGEAPTEEEDISAWDMDDNDAPSEEQPANGHVSGDAKPAENEDADADAWGWGDGGDEAGDAKPSEPTPSQAKPPKVNGEPASIQPSEREMTLKETYTVTAIPDTLLELIKQIVDDAGALGDARFADSPIAPAAVGLYSIPTLVLAMYRATAATYYNSDIAANMLMYNDCCRLSDEVRSFLKVLRAGEEGSLLPERARPSSRLRLDGDIKALETFGNRAYSKEIDSQKTIIRDLLDGAQGFSSCTEAPFAAECDNAIAMTVDRIRDVHRQYQPVLSHSALLQALGSLVATATSKIIVDIEELSDISEEESKKLKHYCDQISTLNELFTSQGPDGSIGDMTGVYCPNWFKFQYLAEILESSLADIKWMWTEGELRLEFEPEEIIELIEALFAESEHRRRALGEIRRTSMGR